MKHLSLPSNGGFLRLMRAGKALQIILGLWLAVASVPVSAAETNFTFRVLSFNIHHGAGEDGRVDLARIAAVITNAAADLVALQEVDQGVARTSRRDLPAELAKLTGLACVFSNNFHFQGGEYGNAVLSRFPILGTTNTHYRMLREGEQRGVLQVLVQTPRGELVLAATHIDYRGDDSERLSNVNELRGLPERWAKRPVIVAGDFNDTPGSRTQAGMKPIFADAWETCGEGDGFTYSADQPKKRIDYQFYLRGHGPEPRKAKVISSDASDHLPLLVEWQWR
jgi:endonuclease/exonuclease/phosphatase family metal-dependent hydrolase